MLKHKGTYEIISPEDIGYERSNEAGIVLGKLRYNVFYYGNSRLWDEFFFSWVVSCVVENDMLINKHFIEE